MPEDLCAFYRLCGGAYLFGDRDYPIAIVEPNAFVRSNPAILKQDFPDDITDAWYVVARDAEEMISIDCDPHRLGRCYDSFWDRHGVAGSCTVVALSFTELLERLVDGNGGQWYWLRDGAPDYGDAYDPV